MEVSADVYERAIHALARQNDDLHRQIRALKGQLAEMEQRRMADLQERERMVTEVHRVSSN